MSCPAEHDFATLPGGYISGKLLLGAAFLADAVVMLINNPVMRPFSASVSVRFFAVFSHLLTQNHTVFEIFYRDKYNMATQLYIKALS